MEYQSSLSFVLTMQNREMSKWRRSQILPLQVANKIIFSTLKRKSNQKIHQNTNDLSLSTQNFHVLIKKKLGAEESSSAPPSLTPLPPMQYGRELESKTETFIFDKNLFCFYIKIRIQFDDIFMSEYYFKFLFGIRSSHFPSEENTEESISSSAPS